MTDSEYAELVERFRSLTDSELENEKYTLRNERRFLTNLSDDDVADRLSAVEKVQWERLGL